MSEVQTAATPAFGKLFERLRPECEAIVARYPNSRSALLPIMHRFQEEEGFVSKDAMRAVAQFLDLSPAFVESTISFYTLFFRRPVGRYMVQVCRNLSCILNGAEEIMAYCREQLGIGHLQTSADGLFSYEEVECLAACDRAPCLQVNLDFVYDLTKEKIDEIIAAIRGGSYATPPLAQTLKPEATWIEGQDTGKKSPGGRDVSDPNNAGGLGDPSGVIMLDRIVANRAFFAGRSKERAAHDAIPHPVKNGSAH